MIDRVGSTSILADIATHHFATTTGIYPHTYSSPFAFAVEICTLACLRLSLSGFPNTTCSGRGAPPEATLAALFSSASFFARCANVKLFHHVFRLTLDIANAGGSWVVFGAGAVVVMGCGSGGEAGEGLSVLAGLLAFTPVPAATSVPGVPVAGKVTVWA